MVAAVFWLGNKIWQGLKSMWAKFRGPSDTGDAPPA
jgi:hypothetical protein